MTISASRGRRAHVVRLKFHSRVVDPVATEQKKYQDKYATELVAMRIKQAKESQLKWLAMVEKEMKEKVCITKAASSS